MTDLRIWLSAAAGEAPSREFMTARRGLSRSQRRAASRAARKGQAATDPAAARLAVAQSRQIIRRRPPASAMVLNGLFVIGFAAVFLVQVARGHVTAVGVVMGVCAVVFARSLIHLPRQQQRSLRAERLNREVLAHAGQPYQEDSTAAAPARLHPAALAVGLVMFWVVSDLIAGGFAAVMDRRALSLGGVVGGGAASATVAIIVGATLSRRGNERRSRRSIS